MNGYLVAMLAIWFLVAWFFYFPFIDNPKHKVHVIFQIVWFIVMGLPALATIWTKGVLG
jgi:hypothetical protein